jgi:hypothetical protein
MKSLKEIRDELVSIGATQRLLELDKERATLIKLINGINKFDLQAKILNTVGERPRRKYRKLGKTQKKGFRYNGTHWMQKPENKARVVAMAKKRAKIRKENGN